MSDLINTTQSKIGLVLSGGGGKGAYQIGIWRALRALGIEQNIVAVSGTSVGALNAALFLKGNLEMAEELWKKISYEDLLPRDITTEDSLFSAHGLEKLIQKVLRLPDRQVPPACYVTCKRLRDGEIHYYEIQAIVDSSYRRQILMASSALPSIYPPVLIDGEQYVDGGANGDNTPVIPLLQKQLSLILVIHLSRNDPPVSGTRDYPEIIDIYPSKDLGDFFTGTLDFDPEQAWKRMKLGYSDGIVQFEKLIISVDNLYNRPIAKSNLRSGMVEKIPHCPKGTPAKQREREKKDMEAIEFKLDAIRKQYEERLQQLKTLVATPQLTNKILWDATVAQYVQTMEKVKALFAEEELCGAVSHTPLLKRMDTFLDTCSRPEFHIALVGAIKAGKSSLINAILEDELASTEVTPETASLTKFRGSKTRDSILITFYSEEEWNQLWTSALEAEGVSPTSYGTEVTSKTKFIEEFENLHADEEKNKWIDHTPIQLTFETRGELKKEIQKWTSSRSATHYFVKEVEVFLKDFALPEGIILVDTPGLNDAVSYRSEITKDYIYRANAVFVCVKADKLSGPELNTIYSVFSNARYQPEKVYIIATQQDALNSPVDDWKKQRQVWLGYLKGRSAYGSLELAERNLITTSGYFYTLLKNQSSLDQARSFQMYASAMKMQCMPNQIGEQYEMLLDFTGIVQLKRRMNTEIVAKYRQLLRADIDNSYKNLKMDIKQQIEAFQKSQKEIIEANAKGIHEIERQEVENQKLLDEAQKEKKELEDLYQKVKKTAAEHKKQVTAAIRALGGNAL